MVFSFFFVCGRSGENKPSIQIHLLASLHRRLLLLLYFFHEDDIIMYTYHSYVTSLRSTLNNTSQSVLHQVLLRTAVSTVVYVYIPGTYVPGITEALVRRYVCELSSCTMKFVIHLSEEVSRLFTTRPNRDTGSFTRGSRRRTLLA